MLMRFPTSGLLFNAMYHMCFLSEILCLLVVTAYLEKLYKCFVLQTGRFVSICSQCLIFLHAMFQEMLKLDEESMFLFILLHLSKSSHF